MRANRMDRGAPATASQPPQGILATIATAASTLLTQPLPMVFPVVVDLWLWRGPRFSPEALLDPVGTAIAAQPGADARLAETLQSWGQTGDLGLVIGWFVPSLLAGADPVRLVGAAARPVVVPGAGSTLLIILAMVLLAAFGLMVFKTPLARLARGDAPFGGGLGREVLRNALRYLGFLGIATVVIVGVALLLGVGVGVMALAGLDLMPVAGLVASLAIIVGAIALAFVAEAITYARVGPLTAVRLSVAVVLGQPWAVVGLLLAVWLVLFTLPQLLEPLLASPIGAIAAIGCYALAATVLALARLIFFGERLPGRVGESGSRGVGKR